MEDYDTFVQIRLSHLRKREEEKEKPLPSSSLIRFYGKPVLPPLLSEEQREEMQRHREAAQKAAVHRKVKDDPRMTHVQTILHSVHLRTTPTLEELLQESEIYTTSSYLHKINDGSGSPSSHFQGTKDDVSLSSPPNRKENNDVALPPFTSTAYSAFLATSVTPRQEGCHMDPCYSQNGSQPSSFNGVSHLSLGYVTYENVENATGVTVGIDSGRESNGFVTSKGADSMNGYFLHNTSNTIAKMPDIISYPPIDGEELERSGLESSFCKDFEDVEDICGTTLQEDSVICESSEGEKSESWLENSTEDEANISVSTLLDLDKDQTLDRVEGHSGFSDNPESSQTSCPHLCPAKEEHLKDDHTDTEQADIHGDEEESSEEPYRLSLQALLKKSQEYRRRQRMLRNQAKNSKIKERTQEQPKARTEEPSLSDKENDEFPLKGSVTAEGKKTKESRGNIIQSVEMSPKKSWDNDGRIESEEKTVSTTSTGDENIKEMTGVEEETTLRNNKLNISPELMTEFKEISAFARQQPMSTETSPVQEAFSLTTSPSDFHRGGGKYKTILAPHFCRSPVRCKSSVQDKIALDETGLLNTGLNKNLSVEGFNFGPQNIHTTVSSKVNVMNEGDLAGVSTMSSQHIDQLESNLSGLKVLISDLESTLTENFRNQGLNGSKQTQSNDEDSNEDSNDAEQNQNELLRRQSLNNSKNSHEDSGSDPSINYMDDGPVIKQRKGTEEVNLSELRLVKTLVTERGKEKCSTNDRLTKSYRHHGGSIKQQPTAKCLLSAAQRLRIPDIFRNVASEAAAPSNVSVLSDTSNHPVDRRNEAAEGSHNSTCSPSLNQSYDVDAPSGLWLLEGSGSDFGTIGHLFEEKHLTPESESEGQSGISKVKRRLLMHMTEDKQDRSADVFRGADSVVRPNSSTPRAAMGWSADHKSVNDRQEQLKQAHAAQVRALQDQHRRQQEELLQALAERFRLLQSVSFPCSMSSSRLGDTLTFTSISQPSSTLSERCRPLLLSAVKGFLTRRLLRTEKVAQLVRTVRDTQQLLQALQQQQSPGRGEFSSRQDLLLQERAALQLRAARYEVNDIFFSLSTGERMQLISWDRELAMEREHRRQSGNTGHPRGKSSLSAATQKSLERKKEMMMQKKAAAKNRTRTGHTAESSAKQPLEKKRGQFKANPQRVPKSTYSSRPR
ncbi:centriolar coiled-coil protein of 110 kDa isoform X1 [Labrus bergylta]|uniref:centriolar coiled-coil protein of 110 kDa isoform X1 n=1 Tax=Labrus bergylta TaxID=56723 RepID=UPI0033133159